MIKYFRNGQIVKRKLDSKQQNRYISNRTELISSKRKKRMTMGIYKKNQDLNLDLERAVPTPRKYPWQALIYKRIAGENEKARHETCLYFEHKDVECAEGWQYFAHTQLCYKLMPPPKQIWYYAEKDCQEKGGHLASIKDEPTMKFILDKILKSTTLTSGLEDTPTYYFIGGFFLLL